MRVQCVEMMLLLAQSIIVFQLTHARWISAVTNQLVDLAHLNRGYEHGHHKKL